MPPRKFSRHSYCLGVRDPLTIEEETEFLQLTEREPFHFRSFSDNRQHLVKTGDTLWTLAGRYFGQLAGGSQLWWVIADFQPDPIIDPTIALQPGSTLVIPSARTVTESIFNQRRRSEHGS